MEYVALISRWLHILPAIAMVGGAVFMRVALVPSLSSGEQSNDELAAQIRKRWAMVVRISILLLLVSGIFNMVYKIKTLDVEKQYHMMLGIKMLLAFGVFFLTSALNGKSSMAEKFREKEAFWLNVNLLLAVAIVCIAGFVKTQNYPPKEQDNENANAAAHIEMRQDHG